MRDYPYRPDQRAIERALTAGEQSVTTIEQTFASGRGAPDVLGIAVLRAWGSVAAAVALEHPLEAVRLLERVAVLVRDHLARWPGPMASWDAVGFAVTLEMAGERAALAALAEHVLAPDGLQTHAGPVASELAFARVLVALLAGRDEAAAAQPAPPGDDEQENLTFTMTGAVLERDQEGLDAAAAGRSQLRMRLAGRSAQNRRNWIYLLDRTAVGIMLAAQDRGLQATPGLPDVPVEIVALRARG